MKNKWLVVINLVGIIGPIKLLRHKNPVDLEVFWQDKGGDWEWQAKTDNYLRRKNYFQRVFNNRYLAQVYASGAKDLAERIKNTL